MLCSENMRSAIQWKLQQIGCLFDDNLGLFFAFYSMHNRR